MLDTVTLQLMTIGCAEDFVASDLGSDDLADDITVGEADDEAVFRCIVLVFGLGDEAFAGVVVGFSFTTTFVLGLVATENPSVKCLDTVGNGELYVPIVGAVLDQLCERLYGTSAVSKLSVSDTRAKVVAEAQILHVAGSVAVKGTTSLTILAGLPLNRCQSCSVVDVVVLRIW